MNTKNFEELLRKFESFPQSKMETTFMEICRHSKSRFEEICSRIMAFYIQPSNEHGLQDLMLKSLFEIIDNDYKSFYDEEIVVETEAHEDGKSLDILVRGTTFVLGIENKIGSEVYNPLEVYKKLIDQFKKKSYRIVLSMRRITKNYELENIKKNDFSIVYYEQLFMALKNNIGNYYSGANSKYVTFLFDFIKTIENMAKSTIIDDPQSIFFFENEKELDTLVKEYNKHKERVLNLQKREIVSLRDEISAKTGVQWWAWQDWDLGYGEFDKNKPRIGIESSYEAQDHDPLKRFRIFITTWNLKDWYFYEEEILKRYPKDKYYLDVNTANRAYLHMDVVLDNDQAEIVKRLEEYYNFLKEIVASK